MKTLCLLASLFCWSAQAHSLSLSFGPSLDGTIGVQKALQLAGEYQVGPGSFVLESGGWNEPNGFAVFGGLSAGIHIVTEDGISARVGFGPCAISQTDDRLSSIFEFHIQARLGLEMKFWGVGVQFDHFSNAGLVPPNLGRDLASLYLSVPL